MQIHQGEHHRVEHGQQLSHRREAHAATIFPQGRIASPVESIFDGPMRTNHLCQPLGRTALGRKTCPAIHHLKAVLVFAGPFAFDPKNLSDLAPVAARDASLRSGLVVIWRRSSRPWPFSICSSDSQVRRSACLSSKKSSRSARVTGVINSEDRNDIAYGDEFLHPRGVPVGGADAPVTGCAADRFRLVCSVNADMRFA